MTAFSARLRNTNAMALLLLTRSLNSGTPCMICFFWLQWSHTVEATTLYLKLLSHRKRPRKVVYTLPSRRSSSRRLLLELSGATTSSSQRGSRHVILTTTPATASPVLLRLDSTMINKYLFLTLFWFTTLLSTTHTTAGKLKAFSRPP